jgi:hypothetical protein
MSSSEPSSEPSQAGYLADGLRSFLQDHLTSSSQLPTPTTTTTGNISVNTQPEGPRTPKRTAMACQFCRGNAIGHNSMRIMHLDFLIGRKLKCDGVRPSCSNCNRRGYPCVYAPVYVGPSHLTLNVLTSLPETRKSDRRSHTPLPSRKFPVANDRC